MKNAFPSDNELHKEIDDWLALAEAGALAPEERDALDRHLAACPACRRIAAAHQAMSTHLKATLEPRRPDAAFEDRLLAKFREEAAALESDTAEEPEPRWTLSWIAAGIARAFSFPAVRYGGALAGVAALVVTGAMVTREPFPSAKFSEEEQPLALKRVIEDQQVTVASGQASAASDAVAAAPAPVAAPIARGEFTSGFRTDGLTDPNETGRNTKLKSREGIVFADVPGAQAFDARKSAASSAAVGGNFWANSVPTGAAQAQAKVQDSKASDAAKKIIRRSQVEMVVPSFDKAVAAIGDAAKTAGGFIDTQGQSRGANGKVSGSLVVKVLPENLDAFLDALAGIGEVKSRTTDAEDISKAYADTTARLANSRRMEARLVKMLEEKDGKVNELLQVERELGRVRSEIETMEAEIRLDDGLVRYATVTIRLRERDLSQGQADRAVLDLTVIVPGGDVSAAVAKARAALAAAAPGAEVLGANLRQDGADGNATTTAEASLEVRAPSGEAAATEAALRALGLVTASSRQETGTDAAAPVRFTVRLLSEAEPLQRTVLVVEVPLDQVEAKAEALKKEGAAGGAFAVKGATFNRDETHGRAELQLRLPLEGYPALLARLRGEGKVIDFNESRNDGAVLAGASGAAPASGASAEITLTLVNTPRLVPAENGLFAALKKTCAEGAAALGWSLRMIGVAVAFLAPWLILAAVAGGIVWAVRKRKK